MCVIFFFLFCKSSIYEYTLLYLLRYKYKLYYNRPFQNGSFTFWAECSRFRTVTNTLRWYPLIIPFPMLTQCKPIWSVKSLRIQSSDPMCQIKKMASSFGTYWVTNKVSSRVITRLWVPVSLIGYFEIETLHFVLNF